MAQIRKIWRCKNCGRIVYKPLQPSPWNRNDTSCGCFATDNGCVWICIGEEK